MSWSSALPKPIFVGRKKPLTTLQDARAYLLALPNNRQEDPEVQAACHALLLAAEGKGPMMFAEMALKRVVNGPVELRGTGGVGLT